MANAKKRVCNNYHEKQVKSIHIHKKSCNTVHRKTNTTASARSTEWTSGAHSQV